MLFLSGSSEFNDSLPIVVSGGEFSFLKLWLSPDFRLGGLLRAVINLPELSRTG